MIRFRESLDCKVKKKSIKINYEQIMMFNIGKKLKNEEKVENRHIRMVTQLET